MLSSVFRRRDYIFLLVSYTIHDFTFHQFFWEEKVLTELKDVDIRYTSVDWALFFCFSLPKSKVVDGFKMIIMVIVMDITCILQLS
jgi:hypothetical protein